MALAHSFDYAKPGSLAEALDILNTHKDSAKILAGGTDLIVHIKEGMIKPSLLIDLKDIAELKDIGEVNGSISIGAGISFTRLIENPLIKQHFPMLWDAAVTVASSGIRNRATLAGNICSAVPSLDSAPALLCHNAVVHLASAAGTRQVEIEDWFKAPRKTALLPDEIFTHITLPLPSSNCSGIYLKLGRYNGEDLAQAGWGIWVNTSHEYRIAHCALAPIPKRATSMEILLSGKQLDDTLIEQAQDLVISEINPISDIRSSKEYRIHISKVMLKRGLRAAQDRLHGKEVEPKALLGGFA